MRRGSGLHQSRGGTIKRLFQLDHRLCESRIGRRPRSEDFGVGGVTEDRFHCSDEQITNDRIVLRSHFDVAMPERDSLQGRLKILKPIYVAGVSKKGGREGPGLLSIRLPRRVKSPAKLWMLSQKKRIKRFGYFKPVILNHGDRRLDDLNMLGTHALNRLRGHRFHRSFRRIPTNPQLKTGLPSMGAGL